MDKQSFGKYIAEKRKELSLTQEQIAELLGVSTPAVNKGKEGGNHGPRTADMDAKEIGRTISTHRKALGLTQMQLAAQLQVSNRTVSKWENGVSLR